MPGGKCPGCGEHVGDWHVEWLAPPTRGPVFRGESGIDCPCCGASILIRENSTIVGVAPTGMPMAKRSRAQAENVGRQADESASPGRLPPDPGRVAVRELPLRAMIVLTSAPAQLPGPL